MHSDAGKITTMYYELLKETYKVDIIPPVGTHEHMSEEEWIEFFGESMPMDVWYGMTGGMML